MEMGNKLMTLRVSCSKDLLFKEVSLLFNPVSLSKVQIVCIFISA